MTETLPDTLPAKLRAAMHELTHHYPVNFIADAAMLLIPEDKRADVAACHFGNDTDAATKAVVRRFGGVNVATAALGTMETGGLIEVLREQIIKLDRAHARWALDDLIKIVEEKIDDKAAISAVTEDGRPIVTLHGMHAEKFIQTRAIASPQDVVHTYELVRQVVEYIQPGTAKRKVAVYREIAKEQPDGR